MLFSTNSFTTEAGRSTTSPAATWLATVSGSNLIRLIGTSDCRAGAPPAKSNVQPENWIAKGGCSGLQYEMTLGEARPGDSVIERDGVKFFVDEDSAKLLRGSTLDYQDALTGAGFQVVNPNAARTCGCGSSFEPTRPL